MNTTSTIATVIIGGAILGMHFSLFSIAQSYKQENEQRRDDIAFTQQMDCYFWVENHNPDGPASNFNMDICDY